MEHNKYESNPKSLQGLKHAVIYCRVSTKEQAEEGTSLITQERLCKEYASRNDYLVVKVFIEFGESAKTADRTELHNLFRYCALKTSKVDTVIVYKLDRLSRNTDDYSYIRLLLRQYKVDIRSTSENFEDTPAGRFMENIIATVAQFDNDMRAERSMGGMREAARQGRYVWMAPIGYENKKVEGKSTIVQSSSAPLVKESFEIMAEGTRTVEEVRKIMQRKGMKSKAGKPISKASFYRMMHQRVYMGDIVKFGEQYRGAFDAIISEDLFYSVQNIISHKDPQKRSNTYHLDFPLTKITVMKNGWSLYGYIKEKKNGMKYYYYSFKTRKSLVRKDVLEPIFCDYIDCFKFSKPMLSHLKERITEYCDRDQSIRAKERNANEKKIEELRDKRTYLLEQGYNRILSRKTLEEEVILLEQQIVACRENIISNETEEKALFLLNEAFSFLHKPSAVWLSLPYENKIQLQKLMFPHKLILREKVFEPKSLGKLFQFSLDYKGKLELSVSNYQYFADLINELEKLFAIMKVNEG